MLMEKSSGKCGDAENGDGVPRKKRSVNLKILEAGGSEKRFIEENDEQDVNNKKRKDGKEICSSGFESDVKKSKKDDVYGAKAQLDFSQVMSLLATEMHGVSHALSDADNLFIYPRRPRGSVGSEKMVTDQVSEPLRDSKTVDRAGAVNKEVINIEGGASDDVASKSKTPVKVGGSNPKLKLKEHSKSTGKTGCPDSKLKANADYAGGSKSKSKQKADSKLKQTADLKPTGKASGSDTKSKKRAVLKIGRASGSGSKLKEKTGLKSAAKVGGSDSILNPNVHLVSAQEIDGSNSKSKQKLDFDLNQNLPDLEPTVEVGGSISKSKPKFDFDLNLEPDLESIEEIGGLDLGEVDAVESTLKEMTYVNSKGEAGNLNSGSTLNHEADIESAGKVGGSNSDKNPNSKSTGRGSSSGMKLSRKVEFKKNGKGKEDDLVVNNGSSKGQSSNNKKKKDLVVGRDGSESLKTSGPSVGSSVQDDIIVIDLVSDDDDDEENLEANAAMMLSSQFDPSVTGFSPNRKSLLSQMSNGLSSSGVRSTPAHDSDLKQTIEDKGKAETKKRRHYYDIPPEDMDVDWFLNKRIKVFWPSDDSWHHGLVKEYHQECMLHQIRYNDRREEWVVLKEEKFKILLFASEVPEKLKSRKRSRKGKNVIKEETAALLSDDDSCIGSDLDSEPIAAWLARSSERVKSGPKSLKSKRISKSDSARPRNNPDRASASMNNLNGCVDGKTLVYVRRRKLKKGEAGSLIVTPRAPVTVTGKQFWAMDDSGRLRLNLAVVESRGFKFQICLPLLPLMEISIGTGDFWVLHNVFMLKQGSMVSLSPMVNLEMLFVDSYEGLRFLLFEGCMKQALAFVFSIINTFIQPDEQPNGDVQVPVTSIRFRLCSVGDVTKYSVFEFHCFSRMLSSKWLQLDSKLLRRCLVIKQLSVSDCTPDNVKELSSYAGFETKFLRGCLPMGLSGEACNTTNVHSESGDKSAPQQAQLNSSLVAVSDIANKDVDPNSVLKEFQKMTVEIPSPDHVDMSSNGKGSISRQLSSDTSWNTNEGLFNSPISTGPRRSKRARSSSISPMWWRPNGPKRPRTHVQYTVPSSGYELNAKQKMQNEKYVPWKRTRRASLKSSNEKKFEWRACNANILITHEDKGWRECGANIVLEGADGKEWILAVKVSGVTKYSYKVKHTLRAGTVNRYSHCMTWKGGKDWVLEFPNRNQWTLFKAMYEECRNRNIRAATMKHIPIPGVTLVDQTDDYGNDVPFVRTKRYIRHFQNDVERAIDPSRVLYDMDSDDEGWLMGNKNSKRFRISEDLFERIMDLLEKISYVERRERFSDDEIEDLVFGVGPIEAGKVIYGYWREKREKMGVPLMRHLQPPRWERYEQELKEWELTQAKGNSEKPPILPFCQKPRGLEVPKVTIRRSQRKLSVNGPHNNNLGFGRTSNTRAIVDEQVSPQDAHLTLGKPVFYKIKSRKVSSSNPSQSQRTKTVNTNGDGPPMQWAAQLSASDLQELKAREASKAAQHARNIAKVKRERAEKLMLKADLAMQKAAKALMAAEAIKEAHEKANAKND